MSTFSITAMRHVKKTRSHTYMMWSKDLPSRMAFASQENYFTGFHPVPLFVDKKKELVQEDDCNISCRIMSLCL